MRSIAIMNQKGGVGKTTTSVNLCAALSMAGKKVLLIDMDPQAHATLHLGQDTIDSTSIYEVLVENEPLAKARKVLNDNLHLIGSSLDLAAAEVELAGVVGREMILKDKLEEDNESYDYIIIDCPPSLGVLTLNALVCVEEVFIPMQPHFLALHGLSKLLETIQLVNKRLNPRLTITGVIMCMFDGNTRLATEVSGDVSDFFSAQHGHDCPWSNVKTFQTKIRKNVRLAEAPSFGQSIFDYDAKSAGAVDYEHLAEEVLEQ